VTTSKGRVGPCSCLSDRPDLAAAGCIHQAAVRQHLLDTRFKPLFRRQAEMRAVPDPDPRKRSSQEIFPEDPNLEIVSLWKGRYEVRDLTRPEAFVIQTGARRFVGRCSCGEEGAPPFFLCRHQLALKAHLVRLRSNPPRRDWNWPL